MASNVSEDEKSVACQIEDSMTKIDEPSTMANESGRMPAVFMFHGGGPLPLLGRQPELASFVRNVPATLPTPSAILVVTAHWEESCITVSGSDRHDLLFDYYGFPPECYKYTYPAPGSSVLAGRIKDLLQVEGIACEVDMERGWDHGVFIPMKLMYPDARIPVVAMSVMNNQDASAHIAVGKALRSLRDEGVLIVGSGASFHNFKYFRASGNEREEGISHSIAFDAALNSIITSEDLDNDERCSQMASWRQFPSAIESHPLGEAEHLMPLFTVFGAGGGSVGINAEGERGHGDDIRFSNFRFE